MDWLEDFITFLPAFLDEPYAIPEEQNYTHHQTHPYATAAPQAAVETLPVTPKSVLPKKRKLMADTRTARNVHSGNERHSGKEDERKQQIGKKGTHGKGNKGNSAGGGCSDARWAEQLLNPLAAAIDAANLSRTRHLLYVLQELACPSGDANHRLAFYGLQALTRRLSTVGIEGNAMWSVATPWMTYATTDTRAFRSALIKYHEVSPWFTVPNCLANTAIMAAAAGRKRLHVVDMGVSHGLQWPTLLEALTRRVGGPPEIMTLTVARDAAGGPFGSAPAGCDYGPQLMRYAKSIKLNLVVEKGDALLGMRMARRESVETMVVLCVQFRAGRTGLGFLRAVREMEPDLVILTELETETETETAEGRFGRRADMLWRFLESTSAAFKGRESEERRIVEGEAARVLEEEEEEEEEEWGRKGREGWRERMDVAGFRKVNFGEEAMEAGKGLLKKYDGNWELKVADATVGLQWKGRPVTFCSLWKPAMRHKVAAAPMHSGSFTRH